MLVETGIVGVIILSRDKGDNTSLTVDCITIDRVVGPLVGGACHEIVGRTEDYDVVTGNKVIESVHAISICRSRNYRITVDIGYWLTIFIGQSHFNSRNTFFVSILNAISIRVSEDEVTDTGRLKESGVDGRIVFSGSQYDRLA